MNEPALDLGMAMAIISSFRNIPVSGKTIVFGEIGLTGEVRSVTQAKQRVAEAIKLGFEECILPYECLKYFDKEDKIKLRGINTISDILER